MQDYYKILGVSPGADTESIHKAWRNLAKVYHPDLNGSEQANAFFILLNEAHDVLTDDNKRIPYDQQYQVWKQGNEKIKNFHYDWDSFNRLAPHQRPKKILQPPTLIMQFVFGLEMFAGFMEIFLILGAIFRGVMHPVYAVCAIPGVLLVIDGWKGFLGRLSVLGGLIKVIKKLI